MKKTIHIYKDGKEYAVQLIMDHEPTSLITRRFESQALALSFVAELMALEVV